MEINDLYKWIKGKCNYWITANFLNPIVDYLDEKDYTKIEMKNTGND